MRADHPACRSPASLSLDVQQPGSLLNYYNTSSCGGVDALTSLLLPVRSQRRLQLGAPEETNSVELRGQIPADMLGRRASSSHPPRSQSEMPHYFNRLLASYLLRFPSGYAVEVFAGLLVVGSE